MKILQVVHMDMAGPEQNADWTPIRAFDTPEAASIYIQWCKSEYGEDIPFQITQLEYYEE